MTLFWSRLGRFRSIVYNSGIGTMAKAASTTAAGHGKIDLSLLLLYFIVLAITLVRTIRFPSALRLD